MHTFVRFGKVLAVSMFSLVIVISPFSPSTALADEPVLKTHVFKFYLDPLLVPDVEYAKSVLPKYVYDLNYVLAKNTNRRLAFDPETGIILTSTKPQTDSAGVLPTTGYEVWAHAAKSTTGYSYDGYMGFDYSGAAVLAGLKWANIYDPDVLTPDTPPMRDYSIQIDHMLHELGHVYGAAIGEYYELATVQDSTGVAPLLDINLQNPTDEFWLERTDYLADPMLRNAYGVTSLGNPTSRQAYLDTARFANITAGIMNGDYRHPSVWQPMPDMNNIKLKVVDSLGNPIPFAQVKIWKIRSFAPYANALLYDTTTDDQGDLTFAWNSNGDPHSNYEHLRLIKTYKDGYEAEAKYVTVYDAETASVINGLSEFTVTTTMTQEVADSDPPQVSVTSPSNGSNLSGNVQISANAEDNVGVSKVEFRLDGNLLAEDTLAPYNYTWDTTASTEGAHSITATAYDNSGNTAVSNAVTVTIDNSSPLITQVSSSQVTSSSALITWTTNEPSNSVVEYGTSQSYGLQAANPAQVTTHSITLSGLSEYTTYHYRVRSTDSMGNSSVTGNFTFTTPDVTGPSVVITSPLNGSTVRVNSAVSINANATDNSSVAKVEFYVNNVLLCTDTTATYTCSWQVDKRKNINYVLTAKAFDIFGNTSTHSVTVRSR